MRIETLISPVKILARQEEIARKQRELNREREVLESQIAALRRQFEAREDELRKIIAEDQQREEALKTNRLAMARSRKADQGADGNQKARQGGCK